MADAIVTTNITGQQQQKQQQQQQQQAQTNTQSNKKKSKNKKKNSTVNNNIINNNNAGNHGGVENSNKFNGIEALNNGKARTTSAETMLTNGEISKLLDQLNITDTPINNGHANCHNGQVTGANEIGIEAEIENEHETETEAEIALDIVATKSKAKSKQNIAQQQKDKHCHATNKLTEEATTTTTIGEQVQQEKNITALSNGHVPMIATVTSSTSKTTLSITNDDVLAVINDVKLLTTQLTTTTTTLATAKTNASSSKQNSTGALPKAKPPSKSTAKTKLTALNIEEPTTSNAAAAIAAAAAAARALATAETEAAAILGLTNIDAKLTEITKTTSSIIAADVGSSNNNNDEDAVNDDDDKTTTAQETITEIMPATTDIHIEYTEYESEHQMHDIMRLIQAELSEPYSIYTYRYFIYNWPKLCFLARHGNDYVGAIVCKLDMHMNVRRGYIAMLAVRKEYRKLKIGTTLVQKAIEAMLADNADEVVLETEMRNVPALRLYENLGFVRDKRLFRYYLNGVDALRLKLWFR